MLRAVTPRDSMVGMHLVYASPETGLAGRLGREVDESVLAHAYPWPDRDVWIRANMVVTVDGRAQAADGLTADISSPEDKRVFGWLRASADAVLVGAGTVRDEGYHALRPRDSLQETRAALGQQPAPVLAIVTASASLDPQSDPFTAPSLSPGTQRPLILTTESATPERLAALEPIADIAICGADSVDPVRARQELMQRGMQRVVCEGGPRLLGELLSSGMIDELDLTISPLLLGQATTGLLTPTGSGTPPLRLTLAHVLEAQSTLLLRYLVDLSSSTS
jgi:riboflavin biosynthesis pyrimidine reductase